MPTARTSSRLIALLWIVLAAPALGAVSRAAEPPETRRIEVRVTVTTNGAPFPAGTFVTMSAPGETQHAIIDVPTDENGQAVLIGEYPAEVSEIVVSIPTILHWGPPEQLTAKNEAAKAADQAFSLPPPKFIALQPGQEVYTVAFFAPEAVTVKGRAVDAQGQVMSVHAHREGVFSVRLNSAGREGFFEVFGVPKAQDSFIFLVTDRREKPVLWLTAAQTGAVLDLGDIVLPAATNNATVEVAVTGRETVRDDLGMQRDHVTFIREDGLAVYTFRVTGQGGIAHLPPGAYTGPTNVQAARYYIVPGRAQTSDSSLKALRLIRSGQRALLDAAGVPVIEPAANQTTAGAIDLAAAQQIIDGLPQ